MNNIIKLILWCLIVGFLHVKLSYGLEADSDYSLQDVLRANDEGSARLKSISATITFSAERFLPERIKTRKITEIIWAFDSNHERILVTSNKKPEMKDGRTNNRHDIYREGRTEKILENWDPKNPQSITAKDQGSIKAWIMPLHRRPLGIDPMESLMLVFTPEGYTLSELFQKKIKDFEYRGKINFEGKLCYNIRCTYLDRGSNTEYKYDFYLDPEADFHVWKMYMDIVSLDTNKIVLISERTVTNFENHDHVYVPSTIIFKNYSSLKRDELSSLGTTQLSNISINNIIDTKTFDFIFPPNAIVKEEPTINGKVRVWLWGPNNKPIREIKSPQDLRFGYSATQENRSTAQENHSAFGWFRIVLTLAGLSLIIYALILQRQKKREKLQI